MELPPTVLGLLIAVVGPAGFGSVISWGQANWAWFANLESGKKTLLISIIGVVFTIVYYLATQVVSPEWFAKADKYYVTFIPYLSYILGEWVFHSQVTVRKEAAAKTVTVTATSSTGSAATGFDKTYIYTPIPPAPGGTNSTLEKTAPPPTLLSPEQAKEASC